jgi:hypothetical protein
LKILARAVSVILAFLGFVMLFAIRPSIKGVKAFLVMLYFACMSHVVFMIIAGSMYIHKKGWVVLRDEQWLSGASKTRTVESWLSHRDNRLCQINKWDHEDQCTPIWHHPNRAKMVTLVDLDNNVSVEGSFVHSERINALVLLAIHGSSVTCMALERAHLPNVPAVKVGMVNMPPYVRLQGEQTSSVHVGRP